MTTLGKLTQYSLFGAAFLATDCIAQNIYVDLDPDISAGGFPCPFWGPSADIDIDGDGLVDFQINTFCTGYGSALRTADLQGFAGNKVASDDIVLCSNYFGSPAIDPQHLAIISSGQLIDSAMPWQARGYVVQEVYYYCRSSLWRDTVAIAAFKLQKTGYSLYGWMRLSYTFSDGVEILDYAYSPVPDFPIAAGDMSSCWIPQNLLSSVDPGGTAATLSWDSEPSALNYRVYGQYGGVQKSQLASSNSITVNTVPGTNYQWTVRANCQSDFKTPAADIENFTTPTLTDAPLMFRNQNGLSLTIKDGPTEVVIFDYMGRILSEVQLDNGDHLVELPDGEHGVFNVALISKNHRVHEQVLAP